MRESPWLRRRCSAINAISPRVVAELGVGARIGKTQMQAGHHHLHRAREVVETRSYARAALAARAALRPLDGLGEAMRLIEAAVATKGQGLAAAAAGINAPLATPLAVAHTAGDLGPLTNGLSEDKNRRRRFASRETPILMLCPISPGSRVAVAEP